MYKRQTSASAEQSDGIEQVNVAITQMDQVTQQNAALVEQAAAAAESMQEQASRLSEVVSIFKLGGSAAMAAPVALANAPRKPLAAPTPARVALAPKKPAKPVKQVANGDEWETF